MVQYTQQPSMGGGSSQGLMQANAQMLDQATGALENIFFALKNKRKMKVYQKLMEQPFSKEGFNKAAAISPELGNFYLNSQQSLMAIEQQIKTGQRDDLLGQLEMENYRNTETLDMADALRRLPEADRPQALQMYMENTDPENQIMQGAIGALNMWAIDPSTGAPDLSDDKLDVLIGAMKPYNQRVAEDSARAKQIAADRTREDTQAHERKLAEMEGNFGLQEQALKNEGSLNTTTVESKTKIMLQDLENQGVLDAQSLKNLAPAQLFAEAQRLAKEYKLNPGYVEQVLGNYKGTNPNFDPGLGGAIPREKLAGGGGGLITAEDLNSKIMGSGGSQPTEQQGQSVPNTPTDPALPQPAAQPANPVAKQARGPTGQGKPKGGGKTLTVKIDGDAQAKPDAQKFMQTKMPHIRAEAKRAIGSGRRVGQSSEELVKKIQNGVKDGSVVMFKKDGKMHFQDALDDELLLSVRE